MNEGRYAQLRSLNPAAADQLLADNKAAAQRRYRNYKRMLAMDFSNENTK